jgi:hypothetical protein
VDLRPIICLRNKNTTYHVGIKRILYHDTFGKAGLNKSRLVCSLFNDAFSVSQTI